MGAGAGGGGGATGGAGGGLGLRALAGLITISATFEAKGGDGDELGGDAEGTIELIVLNADSVVSGGDVVVDSVVSGGDAVVDSPFEDVCVLELVSVLGIFLVDWNSNGTRCGRPQFIRAE